jgi:hypothetical protein
VSFREFAAGISPRAIARRLNDEGVPGPDGALWIDSTLRGHAARGTGLNNNELYVGRLVWNRQWYIKDPSTGRRVSVSILAKRGSPKTFPSFALSTTTCGRLQKPGKASSRSGYANAIVAIPGREAG